MDSKNKGHSRLKLSLFNKHCLKLWPTSFPEYQMQTSAVLVEVWRSCNELAGLAWDRWREQACSLRILCLNWNCYCTLHGSCVHHDNHKPSFPSIHHDCLDGVSRKFVKTTVITLVIQTPIPLFIVLLNFVLECLALPPFCDGSTALL